jgi:hypothetical protein
MQRLVRKIQDNNPNLFQQAAIRNQQTLHHQSSSLSNRKNMRSNAMYSDSHMRALMAESVLNTNAVNGIINYEADNFFETNNDRLIETKHIVSKEHFWERVDQAFFKINVKKEMLWSLENFYRASEGTVAQVRNELGHHVDTDYLNDYDQRDNITLQKDTARQLLANDELLLLATAGEKRGNPKKARQFMADFKRDLAEYGRDRAPRLKY